MFVYIYVYIYIDTYIYVCISVYVVGAYPHAAAHPQAKLHICILLQPLACRRRSTFAVRARCESSFCSSGRAARVQPEELVRSRRSQDRRLPVGNIPGAELCVMRGRGGHRRKTVRRQRQRRKPRQGHLEDDLLHAGGLRLVFCGRQLLLQYCYTLRGPSHNNVSLRIFAARVRRCASIPLPKAAI